MSYHVTCPRCEEEHVTEWIHWLPPGGVEPVLCCCGYMILSESEGNPVQIDDAPDPRQISFFTGRDQ
jgi:hypothetical protein